MTENRPSPDSWDSEAELSRFSEEMQTQTKKRQQMKKALGKVMTPLLRQAGFSGTCPHFRRLGPERYDLLSFEFGKYDNIFVIEIGQCTPDWYRRERSQFFPVEKLASWKLTLEQRTRIFRRPSPMHLKADYFQYGDAKTEVDFRQIAESVVPFTQQALEMFDRFEDARRDEQEMRRRWNEYEDA
jgi:hypothetical protein